MCGIIGYVGSRPAKSLLLGGLERLEYRGYDSAGLALLEDDGLDYVRAVGNLDQLKSAAGAKRLATRRRRGPHALGDARPRLRGERASAHRLHPRRGRCRPERDRRELRRAQGAALVEAGHTFTSETDAEVVVHLVEDHYAGDLIAAVQQAYAELEGHFAFVVIHRDHPGLLVGARLQCPLVVGAADGETFVASSIAAFQRETQRVQLIEDGEIVAVTPEGARFLTRGGRARPRGARRRLGRRVGREARLRELHAEGDLRAAERRGADDRRVRRTRTGSSSTSASPTSRFKT